MALNPKFSTGFRNALLNGTDVTTMFNSGFLDIYSGSQPTDADATEGSGTLLASVALPVGGGTDAFAASAASGAISKNGTWQDASANAAGTATWFRLYDSAHTTGASTTAIRIDGTASVTANTPNIVLNNNVFTVGDPVTIDTFTITLTA